MFDPIEHFKVRTSMVTFLCKNSGTDCKQQQHAVSKQSADHFLWNNL